MLGQLPVLNKDSPVPLYKQLANWMASRITGGEWPANYQLPAEVDLAKELKVSRGSLRKAVALLVARNLLWQVHGKGTFVHSAVVEQRWAGELAGTAEDLIAMGIPFVTEVLEQRLLACPEREARVLALRTGEEVVCVKRLRRVGDVPTVLHENYLPAVRCSILVGVDLTQKRLLGALEEYCGVVLTSADHVITAIRADVAIASYLQIEVGDPVLCDEHVFYDEQGLKVEAGKSWFCSDRVRLRSTVRRRSGDDIHAITIPIVG